MDKKYVTKRSKNLQNTKIWRESHLDGTQATEDNMLENEVMLDLLQLRYAHAYVLNRVYICPETMCNIGIPAEGIVEHIKQQHYTIPRQAIQLGEVSNVSVNLPELMDKTSSIISLLYIWMRDLTYRDTVSDITVLPLILMAAKVNPFNYYDYREIEAAPPTDQQRMFSGDVLMFWICGHVETMSSIIKLQNNSEKYVFEGRIHSIADSNFMANTMVSRGSCLFVPASTIKQLTNNWQLPLNIEIVANFNNDDLTN